MGSSAKTSEKDSISDKDVTIEKEVAGKPKEKSTKKSGSLEAFDTPVPLVIPPHETRSLKVRNCGSDDIEIKVNIHKGEGSDETIAFEVEPSEAIIKPNAVFIIKVTYNAVEEKFDPEEDKPKRKTRGKAAAAKTKTKPVDKHTKMPGIVEVVVGEKDFYYMYPILGSGDPKDEALAMQKHINLSNVMDSDEENEKEEAPKNKRKSKVVLNGPSKIPKLDKEVTIVLTRFLPSRMIPNAEIKEEVEENIEIKEEPLN